VETYFVESPLSSINVSSQLLYVDFEFLLKIFDKQRIPFSRLISIVCHKHFKTKVRNQKHVNFFFIGCSPSKDEQKKMFFSIFFSKRISFKINFSPFISTSFLYHRITSPSLCREKKKCFLPLCKRKNFLPLCKKSFSPFVK